MLRQPFKGPNDRPRGPIRRIVRATILRLIIQRPSIRRSWYLIQLHQRKFTIHLIHAARSFHRSILLRAGFVDGCVEYAVRTLENKDRKAAL